jgi:hypothetical protein
VPAEAPAPHGEGLPPGLGVADAAPDLEGRVHRFGQTVGPFEVAARPFGNVAERAPESEALRHRVEIPRAEAEGAKAHIAQVEAEARTHRLLVRAEVVGHRLHPDAQREGEPRPVGGLGGGGQGSERQGGRGG